MPHILPHSIACLDLVLGFAAVVVLLRDVWAYHCLPIHDDNGDGDCDDIDENDAMGLRYYGIEGMRESEALGQ